MGWFSPQVLDLRETQLFNLPREFARLKTLRDINMDGVPLKLTIKSKSAQREAAREGVAH